MSSPFDQRPLIVAVAGPNGAGKTTFYHAHLKPAGLRFINADVLADELDMEPYAAAAVAGTLRDSLVQQGESFVFETVFSDPVGDKLAFLERRCGTRIHGDPVFHRYFQPGGAGTNSGGGLHPPCPSKRIDASLSTLGG